MFFCVNKDPKPIRVGVLYVLLEPILLIIIRSTCGDTLKGLARANQGSLELQVSEGISR